MSLIKLENHYLFQIDSSETYISVATLIHRCTRWEGGQNTWGFNSFWTKPPGGSSILGVYWFIYKQVGTVFQTFLTSTLLCASKVSFIKRNIFFDSRSFAVKQILTFTKGPLQQKKNSISMIEVKQISFKIQLETFFKCMMC